VKEQIQKLLSNGLSQTQAAAAVGCDDSYVSQLMAEEEFASAVAAGRAAKTAKFIEADETLEDAESAALKRVKALIPMITKPVEAARVFSVLNAAHRRASEGAASQNQESGDVVTLVLPKAATKLHVAIELSSDKQVIDVEGRSMVTMPAKTLAQRLEARKTEQILDVAAPMKLTLANNL